MADTSAPSCPEPQNSDTEICSDGRIVTLYQPQAFRFQFCRSTPPPLLHDSSVSNHSPPTHSELSRLGSGYSVRCFGSVDRLSSRHQFSAKGGYWKSNAVTAGASDAAALSSDAIVLNVRGMLCEGCVASVQRILENQEPVSSASVNLTTETAIVWPVSDAKVAPGWQKDLGRALAKH